MSYNDIDDVYKQFHVVGLENSYTENNEKNRLWCNAKELFERIKNNGKDDNKLLSYFTIIYQNYCCLYFDIENVEYNNKGLIYSITEDITNFAIKYGHVIIKDTRYKQFIKTNDIIKCHLITKNEHSSHHKGLSYHLYLYNVYVNKMKELEIFVKLFLTEHPEYKKYLDTSVYSKNRLFRLPLQKGIDRCGLICDPEDKHIPLELVDANFVEYSNKYCINTYRNHLLNDDLLFKIIIYSTVNFINYCSNKITFKWEKGMLAKIRIKCVENKKKQKDDKPCLHFSNNPVNYYYKDMCDCDEQTKDIILGKQKSIKYDEKAIYDLAVSTCALTTNKKHQEILNDIILHYDKNKTFNAYTFTPPQIINIINIIKEKI